MLSIKFDADKFTNKLKGIELAAIPEAQKKSLYKFGFLNKKKMMPYMARLFRNPVPLTLSSVLYKVENEDSMFFFIKSIRGKGNSPRKYLAPVEKRVAGGLSPAYETKFSYWLRNYSGLGLSNRYPIPVLKSAAVEPNKYGTGMKASQYSKVKAGLIKSKGSGKITGNQYKYFAVPSNGKRPTNKLGDGIYRVKGGNVGLLFTLAKRKPQVARKFEFFDQTARHLKKDMPYIFKSELRKSLAKIR
tara:strand:+ start:400 stop:1134 length:735 start_codon:yes stop_codon:yes gene_type:complete